uniref:Uncharacterized protein n=1 Tax=Vannella robusta TaxID=1487602 RepID=A0A7S4MCU3_9EUKA|mmetsp:Transcript_18372/g.23263  ORF Transcript_18372/g.23263 Transcript_18372/m.23263 type:complete len:337 (+) Transcript_18372:123-1133(+)
MTEKLLVSTSFLPRKIVLLTQSSKEEVPKITCMECGRKSDLVATKDLKTQCKHEELCTECRDYQIEKFFRCIGCCETILGFAPPFCCAECQRQRVTQKSSALCTLCDSNLQRECKYCKHSAEYKNVKRLLKKRVFVLVQSPQFVGITQRPCSHYALCKQCKQRMARGHKGKSLCTSCRQDNAITISSFTPNIVKSSAPPGDEESSVVNFLQTGPIHYTSNSRAFSGHSVLSVANKHRRAPHKPHQYCRISQAAIHPTFLGVGDDLARGFEIPRSNVKISALENAYNHTPTLPSFRSLLNSSGSNEVQPDNHSDMQAKILPVAVDETSYNVCTNKIW